MTEPGPLAEELARFLGATHDWLQRSVLDPATARISTGAPECCWCPICQLVSAVRGDRPELLERLGEVQASIVSLLRTVTESAPTPTAPEAGPRVHKIDLSGAAGGEG